jgi:ubiquinone/menaquinone biosynthesis C-methylase UbiE
VKRSAISTLRCPACREKLELEADPSAERDLLAGSLLCACGRGYPIENGIPNLIYPDQLLPSDAEFKQKYDRTADSYDQGLDWLFNSFYEDENTVRTSLLELLDLRPGLRVLEVGCGTGKDSIQIASYLGSRGELYIQDISASMIDLARRRLAGVTTEVEYFVGNAAYLPFDDRFFNAVFHFGGLNTFGDIRRALAEMTRVVRVGGKIVVGDEGVAPWLRKKKFGRVLINANPLYHHWPPLECLPENAREVTVRWILGNAFYLIDYRVGDGPPKVDLDLPIPGKGDSLRSRYQLRPRR